MKGIEKKNTLNIIRALQFSLYLKSQNSRTTDTIVHGFRSKNQETGGFQKETFEDLHQWSLMPLLLLQKFHNMGHTTPHQRSGHQVSN